MTSVRITCPVNPSEDPDKALAAIRSIFPDAELELVDRGYEGTAPSLDGFGRLIRRQKILDASRSILLKNMHGSTTRMSLNKQVATVGKVSFADRNPVLGAIDVTVEDDDLEALIDRVAPMTVDGEEVKHDRDVPHALQQSSDGGVDRPRGRLVPPLGDILRGRSHHRWQGGGDQGYDQFTRDDVFGPCSDLRP